MTTTTAPRIATRARRTTDAVALRRLALLAPAAIALLAGLDAALILLDLPAPVRAERLPQVHGFLLVLGFVGTLISLERAVALGRRVGTAAPVLLGVGALLLVSPAPIELGKAALLGGSAALALLYVPLWRRQRDDAVLIQALGAVLAVGASALWLGGAPVPVALPWLVGFVVLTIAGERVELTRLELRSSAPAVVVSAALVGAVVASLLWPTTGYALLGIALLLLVGWLAVNDVARRTIRSSGLPRFTAACLLAGYGWLAVAGATWLVSGPALEGVAYDAVVHAVFLGFTISMILAHAPVILPAVLRRPLPYHPVLWVPAVLLHLSLVTRVWLGDALGSAELWRAGAAVNIVAVLTFAGCAVWLTTAGTRTRHARRSTR